MDEISLSNLKEEKFNKIDEIFSSIKNIFFKNNFDSKFNYILIKSLIN